MNWLLRQYIEAFKGLPRSAWVLAGVVFTNSAGKMMLAFLALYLSIHHRFSVSDVGLVIASYGVGSILGAYAGGRACDRFDVKRLMAFDLVALGMTCMLLAFAQLRLEFMVLVFLFGLWDGAFYPIEKVNIMLLRLRDAADRSRVYAMLRVSTNLGAALAGAMGALLWSLNPNLVFFVNGLTCILSAVVAFMYLEGYVERTGLASSIHSVAEDLKQPLRDGLFLALCVVAFFNVFIFFQIKTTYPYYLNQHYQMLPEVYGFLFVLNGLMTVVFQMPLTNFLKRWNSYKVAMIGAGCLSIGFMMLPFGNTLSYAVLSCVLWTIGELILFPILLELVFECAEGGHKGEYMAVYGAMFSAVHVVAPVVGSGLYSQLGANTLWLLCGILGLLSMGGFRFIRYALRNRQTFTPSFIFKLWVQSALESLWRMTRTVGTARLVFWYR